MPKYIYQIANSDGENAGELEIDARNADEGWDKKRAAEKSGEFLQKGEYIYEWREAHEPPSGVKRR